jgi:hypothetical protein
VLTNNNNNSDNRVKERFLAWTSNQKSLSARVKRRNKTMRKLQLTIMAAALVIAAQARATLCDITFTEANGGPTDAIGQIDVVNGVAVSGFLNVSGGPKAGSYTLAGPTTDGSFVWDNAVSIGSAPFLPGTGLVWTDGSSEVNLWYNTDSQWGPTGTYGLWGAPPNWTPEAFGDATLTLAAVPEPTTLIAGALLLLPFGASTIRILRKKVAA